MDFQKITLNHDVAEDVLLAIDYFRQKECKCFKEYVKFDAIGLYGLANKKKHECEIASMAAERMKQRYFKLVGQNQ